MTTFYSQQFKKKRNTSLKQPGGARSTQIRCCYASKVLPSSMFRTVCVTRVIICYHIWGQQAEAGQRWVRKKARVLMTLRLSLVWPGGNAVPTSSLLPVAAQPLARVGQQSRLSSSRIYNIMKVTVGGNFEYMVANCVGVCFCVWRKHNFFNMKWFCPSKVLTYIYKHKRYPTTFHLCIICLQQGWQNILPEGPQLDLDLNKWADQVADETNPPKRGLEVR